MLALLLSSSGLIVPRVFACMINVCSYLVWMQRMDFRFQSIPSSAVKLIALMKALLSFYLPLFVKRFTSTRRWSYLFRQWAMGCLDPFYPSFLSIFFFSFLCSVILCCEAGLDSPTIVAGRPLLRGCPLTDRRFSFPLSLSPLFSCFYLAFSFLER